MVGAVLGEVPMLLFLPGAIFGINLVLLFVVGVVLGKGFNVRLDTKFSIVKK